MSTLWSSAPAPKPKPRGICPECGKWIQLKADGRLRYHTVRRRTEYWGRAADCDGAGMLPKPEAPAGEPS